MIPFLNQILISVLMDIWMGGCMEDFISVVISSLTSFL